MTRRMPHRFVVSLWLAILPVAARADDAPSNKTEDWAVRGQATFVLQGTPGFPSPYSGPNSLAPDQAREKTIDATLNLWVRPHILPRNGPRRLDSAAVV